MIGLEIGVMDTYYCTSYVTTVLKIAQRPFSAPSPPQVVICEDKRIFGHFAYLLKNQGQN